MVEYTTIFLKFQDTSQNFSFYFYYHEGTTIGDLLEYIINYFQEKKICLCFQLHQMKNNNYDLIELNYNFKEYISINNSTFYIFIPKGNGCQCDQITKDNIKKSKKEIIKQLKDKASKLFIKEKEIEKFKNEIQILKEKNDKLENEQKDKKNKMEEENIKFKNEIKELKAKEENINNNLIEKEKEIENFKNEIQILKKKNDNLENEKKVKNNIKKKNIKFKNEIKELKAKEENINKNLIEKEKEIEKFKNEIKILQKDKQLLEIAINGDITTINQLKNLGVVGEYLKPKENIIKVDPETNKIITKGKINKDIIFIDFYDVIIDINSIKDINKGWGIKMSEKAKHNYQSLKNGKIIKIGVIGNSNKGKSFILSKLSKIDLPSGPSIRTEGLSVKYPDLDIYNNRKIVLLDSAGLETPVLKNFDSKVKKEKEEKEEKKKKEEIEEKEEHIEMITKGKNEYLKEEEFEIDNKNEKELFKEKSREKLITELFLQNYIIYNANILIIVVGILTYSEQKLINRI